MYMNTGYLNHSHMDFKDKSRPLVVGSCGTYRLSSQPRASNSRSRSGAMPVLAMNSSHAMTTVVMSSLSDVLISQPPS